MYYELTKEFLYNNRKEFIGVLTVILLFVAYVVVTDVGAPSSSSSPSTSSCE